MRLPTDIVQPVCTSQLWLELIKGEKFNGLDLTNQVLFTELISLTGSSRLLKALVFRLSDLGVIAERPKNRIAALLLRISGHLGQDFMPRQLQVFYESFEQLFIRVLACVFVLKLAQEDLLLELDREESLHLVRELLSIIDIQLIAAQSWIVLCQNLHLELQLDVTSHKHVRPLDICAV